MNNYMKRLVKYGLFRSVTSIITLTAISYWIGGRDFLSALTAGVIGGLIVGVLTSFVYYKYTVPKYVLDAVSIDIDADEEVRFQTLAHCTSVQEPVSGKLFLTNKRLIFRNHKQDKSFLHFSIDLRDIDRVHTFKSLGLFKNGLSIHTASGDMHTFIVDPVKKWVLQLQKVEKGFQHGTIQNAV